MGAAATYAAKAQPSNTTTSRQTQNVDLFSSSEPVAQQPKKTLDLFGAKEDDDDDFNPRGSSDTKNANGDFGDFESAFGSTTTSNNHSSKSNGSDGFADFSTAFGANNSSSTKLPAPPTPPPSTESSSIDLFGGPDSSNSLGGVSQQGPSSNIDLLGGLVMNNQPPPLMGVAPTMGAMMGVAPPSQQNDLFGTPVMLGGQFQQQSVQQSPMLGTLSKDKLFK